MAVNRRFQNPKRNLEVDLLVELKWKLLKDFYVKQIYQTQDLQDLNIHGQSVDKQEQFLRQEQIEHMLTLPGYTFPETKVIHLPCLNSNHCPIHLKTHPNYNRGTKPFRFEPFWMSQHTFVPLTTKVWQQNPNNLTKTITKFQEELTIWNKTTFGNILHEVRRSQARQSALHRTLDYRNDPDLRILEEALQKHMNQLLDNEESIWEMKSRLQWLTLGDRNIAFFHATTLNKRRRNKILQIQKLDQSWIT